MSGDDRGAATILALALVHLLLLVGLVGAIVGSVVVVKARTAAVADLAALAAAESWADPCADARAVAQANGMAMTACGADGADAVVSVSAPAPELVRRWLALIGREGEPITVSARAGLPWQ